MTQVLEELTPALQLLSATYEVVTVLHSLDFSRTFLIRQTLVEDPLQPRVTPVVP